MNLPAALTSLVGRERELEALAAVLPSVRLLTLTGPGGVGKTRLALALAGVVAAAVSGGTWWIELAAGSDPAAIGELVAAALGVPQLPAIPPGEAIAAHLQGAPALLVLDNCEHVADGCAALAVALLSACPELTVLATSRQTLGVPGEQVWPVAGLPLHGAGDEAGDGAVGLFLERARNHAPSLAVDERQRAAIERICSRLDGSPLAIELAAARTAVLAPEQMADRLPGDGRLLTRRAPGAPARHQSLEAALDWSHRLLTPREQAVFRRLSIFRGSFSLAAAETVGAGPDVAADEVLDALRALVDQSLVQSDWRAGESSYRLLKVVRQYGGDRLVASGEFELVRAAHAQHCVALAMQAQTGLAGADQRRWLDRLEAEHENLRAGLAWAMANEPSTGARLAALLWPFWYRRGHYGEGRAWLEQAAAEPDLDSTVRAGVLTGAGVLAYLQCDYAVAVERLEVALRLSREVGDRRGIATVLQQLGSVAREQGRYADARRLHEQSLALWQELDAPSGVAASLDFLGFAAWLEGDFRGAAELSARALVRFRAAGEEQEVAAALINLGTSTHYAGDLQRGRALLEEALILARATGYLEGIAWSLHELAIVARRGHEPGRAAALLCESLRLHRRLGDRWRLMSAIEEAAGGLLVRLDPLRAASLLAAAGAARESLGTPRPQAERRDYDAFERSLRRLATASDLEAARATGRAMTLEQAVDDAMAGLHSYEERARNQRLPSDALLTEREQAVLALLSEGCSNREIGAALFISQSTAGVHVSNILRKLGVRGRVQAAARARELGLLPATRVDSPPHVPAVRMQRP